MRANAIEAAEQCNLVLFPKCGTGTAGENSRHLGEGRLVYCDETTVDDSPCSLKSVGPRPPY